MFINARIGFLPSKCVFSAVRIPVLAATLRGHRNRIQGDCWFGMS